MNLLPNRYWASVLMHCHSGQGAEGSVSESPAVMLWLEQHLSLLRDRLDAILDRGFLDTDTPNACEIGGANPDLQAMAEAIADCLVGETVAIVGAQDRNGMPLPQGGLVQAAACQISAAASDREWVWGQAIARQTLEAWQADRRAWPVQWGDRELGWLVVRPLEQAIEGIEATAMASAELDRSRFIERVVPLVGRAWGMLQMQRQIGLRSQTLQRQNQELQQISQLKSEFLANTSHEIRTPLSSILGFTHLLREQGFNPGNLRHQEYLKIILSSGQHLLALINDILDLSKIEANQLDLRQEWVAVEPLCHTVLALVQEKANDRGLALTLDVAPEVGSIYVDPLRLKQMLFNLLSNALKFTLKGGVGLRVRREADQVRLTVWDTGTGIPIEQQMLLFRPYRQLANPIARPGEGTGLGLALTQKLAELHQGWVELKSEAHQGSEFTIVLPVVVDTQNLVTSADPGSTDPESSTTEGSASGGKSLPRATQPCPILLVEDNVYNAQLLTAFLGKLGYDLTWVKDHTEMWQALEQTRPALILMDINLPGVGGLALIRELRSQTAYHHLPIIVQTAMAMAGDRETCLEAGATDYVAKPIDLAHLAHLLVQYSAAPSSEPEH